MTTTITIIGDTRRLDRLLAERRRIDHEIAAERRRGIEGQVVLIITVDANGNAVKNYAVIKTIKDGEIVYFSTYNG